MSAQPIFVESALIVTEIHSDTETHLTEVLAWEGDEVVLRRSRAQASAGAHAWLELAAGELKPVKVLAQLLSVTQDTARYAIKFVLPHRRERLMRLASLVN